jgi:hypothetical protein
VHLRPLLNWIRPPLREYEQLLLQKTSEALPSEARALFQRQIEGVNFVQRHSADKEVNLYSLRGGKPFFDPTFNFPNATKELSLARLSFKRRGEKETTKADLIAVRGRVFSLHFNRSPKGLDATLIEGLEVKLLADPMEAVSTGTPNEAFAAIWRDWREGWAKKWKIKTSRAPLPSDERDRLLSKLDTKLPDDFRELLQDCDGFVVEKPYVRVFGANEIREVTLESQNIYVLAQGEEMRSLAVRREAHDGKLYFVEHEGQTKEMGYSFRLALEELLTTADSPKGKGVKQWVSPGTDPNGT